MPVGARSSLLRVTCVGLDGSSISDTITTTLAVPHLAIDSIAPQRFAFGCATVHIYSKAGTFVSGNGVDYFGTISGFSPDPSKLIHNNDTFQSPYLWGTGECLGSGQTQNYDRAHYYANHESTDAPIMMNVRVVVNPNLP